MDLNQNIDFSTNLNLEFDKSLSYEEFKSKSFYLFEKIVKDRFPNNPGKQRIHLHTDRITGACPYCGDSMQSDFKHRGNIILKGKFAGYYKCFNCGVFKSVINFFSDYKVSLDLDFINYLSLNKIEYKRPSYGKYDISLLINNQLLEEYAIDRDYLKKSFNLVEVHNTPIISWLRKRLQFQYKRFLYNYDKNFLVILNLTKNGKILGFQRRNFDKRLEKYNTYNIRRIYNEISINKEIPDEIDSISQIYGISEVDFSNKITLFEGPLDSFLFYNSVANAGASKSFPLDIPIRYWYDDDKKGREKSVEKIEKGFEVFLWTRFRNDLGLPWRKKWDLNDVLIWLKENGRPKPIFDYYFSSDPLDILDI
ncbi:MAG TPA: hypothetical protein P5513_04615 [Candidatus Diapherotrites archaeon]|nr:hypothetical protein [Candidatus Diapherotrites archaeon]